MIEEVILNFLDENTSLVKGVDLWIFELPQDVDFGAYIRIQDIEFFWNQPQNAIVNVFVVKNSYKAGRTLCNEIKDALCTHKGLIGDGWSSGGSARITSLGENPSGDVLFAVQAEIKYEGV